MRSNGFRRGTRKLISKDFKKHGKPGVSKLLQEYNIGDFVDCKIDASIVKGMPHKYYHGKTGVVYNCNPRAIGVVFNKLVGGKYNRKLLHVRAEHLTKSRCNEDLKKRYAEYKESIEKSGDNKGLIVKPKKRMPEGPASAVVIPKNKVGDIIEIAHKPYAPFF